MIIISPQLIQMGDSTHSQLQLMTLQSFRTMNTIARSPENPIPLIVTFSFISQSFLRTHSSTRLFKQRLDRAPVPGLFRCQVFVFFTQLISTGPVKLLVVLVIVNK